jgi:DNA-binding protein HU-beta
MTAQKTGNKRMSQSEIINHIAETKGIKRDEVKVLFEELCALAASEVKANREFVLPGFGKLVKSERKARMGRNPLTGDTIQIPSKTVLKFRLSKGMKLATYEDPVSPPDYIRPADEGVTPPDY